MQSRSRFFSDLHHNDPKEFWKKIASLSPQECTIPTLSNGSDVAESNLDKANLLNATFTNSFNCSLPELRKTDLPEITDDDIPANFLCTENKVYDLLCSLDTAKASGHNGISARMLKETALSITPAVTELFNISIRLGEIPDEWKIARISPIPKTNDRSNPGKY